ncbi:X-ray radiation resistance-associated protein 1 [Cyprinodon tularosa]|uniref:X-ray radiation resistance-associated protein 1 n=1 Tax=Cyprinodon tularosa TaxID=77115 RepID=UPI0018E1EFCA|nr:X-ray radiation resistance-associated protein 1 [Cyprinodon tularosa]
MPLVICLSLQLRLHHIDEPSQLCSVVISDQKLNSVEPEELKAFTNVAYINASDNFLSLGLFSCFPSLRELDLSLNRISNMVFDAAAFPHLEVLDLSYNRLPPEDLLPLGQIPCLKTLHLSGNRLHSLPPGFGSTQADQSDMCFDQGAKQFEALEVLMLDDNRLTSSVFYSLRNLKRLKLLNLQGNRISEIPHLEMQEGPNLGRQSEDEAHTESKIDHRLQIIDFFHSEREGGFRGSSPFLPELQRLSLADNEIISEEALVPAALFPKLCELDIHSNPLIKKKRGDTPLLTYYLQEKLGITIKKKMVKDVLKFPHRMSTYPGWEVEESLSKLSHRAFIPDAAHVRHRQGIRGSRRDRGTTRSEDKNKNTCQENAKQFFITQIEGKTELQLDSSSNQKEAAQNKEGNRIMPKRPTCYDMIMDAKPLPYIGIQTAVWMLERTLRKPNIYRDSKPRLDSIQTPYREMKKRIKDLPPLKPIKPPTQRVEELIKEMKESTTVKVVALGTAIHNKEVNRADYQEAVRLLRDLKKKHKMVYEKTMEQESRVQFERRRAEHPPL